MFHGWQHLRPEDREKILRGIVDGKVYGGPYHLEMDWVDKCNARCFFCNSEYIHQGESMPWGDAERHLEGAQDLRSIRLCGGGEPTLHPNFVDLLELLARRDIILDNLTTNGTQLSAPVIEALMKTRVTDVLISLNYPTAETYAHGMGLPEKFFERVTAMACELDQARRGNKNFGRLAVQFFVYQPTKHLLRDSYELARGLGADLIMFRELWEIQPELYFAPDDVPAIADQMRDILRADWGEGRVVSHLASHGIGERITQIYRELRAELGGGVQTEVRPVNESIRYCYIGWHSMTVLGRQAVYPCCYLLPINKTEPVGSLKNQTLGEIWRGEAYARYRKEIRDYILLERRIPFFERRVKEIVPHCATHDGCPITRSMCDDDFYKEAQRRLELVRRRPDVALWRLVNRAGRVVERRLGLGG